MNNVVVTVLHLLRALHRRIIVHRILKISAQPSPTAAKNSLAATAASAPCSGDKWRHFWRRTIWQIITCLRPVQLEISPARTGAIFEQVTRIEISVTSTSARHGTYLVSGYFEDRWLVLHEKRTRKANTC